ncbi:hypothetical protein KS4_27480 [Poriferisphaera corsica]|uniref:Uncharacterized protein n=1 Tax=Poriferisphaera corsica TaxID=2528020 RepID=A0A517YWR8_9BACT|nr:hypothetical protein KS4_27480 [Poriferisphaera corsica]
MWKMVKSIVFNCLAILRKKNIDLQLPEKPTGLTGGWGSVNLRISSVSNTKRKRDWQAR